jgi:16S rRNA (uracil1498-N3)-methyltransferase
MKTSTRSFLCPGFPDRGPARLPPGESRHLATVLRAAPGDEIRLLDGRGRRARARLTSVQDGAAVVDVLAVETLPRGSGPDGARVALAAAIPKGNRADWMIQKAVEVGLDAFFPILTRRGVATAEGAAKRARWERIAAEAAKQSGRAVLPELHEPRPLAEIAELTAGWPLRTVADADGGGLGRVAGDAVVFVGPEGGWSAEERALLAGLVPLKLGPYTLRVETAAVLAVARLAGRGD